MGNAATRAGLEIGAGERAAPVIELRDVYKSYGETKVLSGLSLRVYEGEVLVIIGPSGGGKSTLLRCVNALEPVDSGTVIFKGIDLAQRDLDILAVRRRIGIVFQQFNLFPHLTVLENLVLAPRKVLRMEEALAHEQARRLLTRVGLADKERSYPHQLSGGQQQRVAIARALMMRPEVMLFDEVTSALDPELVGEVLAVMRDLAASGMTMLVVTHEMAFGRDVGDRLVFIADGRIVEEGLPRELLSNPKHDRTRQFLQRTLST